jgi:hypothetical protein
MSAQGSPILVLPVKAIAVLTARRFVTLLGAVPAAAAGNVGVAQMDAAIGDTIPVTVVGTDHVEAGAAVAAGALIEIDNQGRAITRAAGIALGRALEAAGAAGDRIEVLLGAV